MARKMRIVQKTFVSKTVDEMDKQCNDFRKLNPDFKFVATQVHFKDDKIYSVLFWEVWEN